ncbi:cyclic nucleotide-binding protein [Legionella beliardensis]|uniref:Cyclic nucleotide-binding protein n=1 Tax=Legionella beliardensis TaxID=91822 RepID=A0A378I4H5_9GAMM|nr:cyclic nucleotide-binding domain-containing protein [Legionella beliardensis]STX29596.1 cyclic nucleotide-binding protein [Legionella beliardensis]
MILLEKLALLRTVDIFKNVSDDLLIEVAGRTTEEYAKAGTPIVKKGDLGDILYIISSGKVAIQDGNRILATLGAKQIFGELAVLSPKPRTESVVALENCSLLKLKRFHLFEHMDVNFTISIIDALCQRIRNMAKQIDNLSRKNDQVA